MSNRFEKVVRAAVVGGIFAVGIPSETVNAGAPYHKHHLQPADPKDKRPMPPSWVTGNDRHKDGTSTPEGTPPKKQEVLPSAPAPYDQYDDDDDLFPSLPIEGTQDDI